jgi:hypothetical protein
MLYPGPLFSSSSFGMNMGELCGPGFPTTTKKEDEMSNVNFDKGEFDRLEIDIIDELDAAEAYKDASRKYHGNFVHRIRTALGEE